MFKVLNDRILTFQIKGARKTKGDIYVTDKFRRHRDFSDVTPVWIAQVGKYSEMYGEIEPGQVGLILDHFELEEISNVWDDYKDDPRFALLKKRAEEVDGEVFSSTMTAASLVALIDLCEPEEAKHRVSFGEGHLREFGVRDE